MKSFIAVTLVAAASLVSARPFVMEKNTEALHPTRNFGGPSFQPHHAASFNGTFAGKPHWPLERNAKRGVFYPGVNGTLSHIGGRH